MSRVRRLPFRTRAQQQAAAATAAEHLRAGGILIYPTETVYGFGCALAPAPLRALVSIKRSAVAPRPFLLLLPPAGEPTTLRWTESARHLASAFWPGPLTLALEAEPGAFPGEVTAEDGTVAVRRSPHEGVQSILLAYGAPITSTSANRPGEAPARDGDDAMALASSLTTDASLLVLDGGALADSPPSTLVRVTARDVQIVREGAIGTDTVRRVLREADVQR